MKDRWTLFTKMILDFMFYAGILVTLTLPFSIKLYGKWNNRFVQFYYEQLAMFFVSGVFAILIIGELRKMFRTVLADDCFIVENVVSLQKMGTYSFMIALATTARACLYLTPANAVVFIVFIIAGLFSKVLARVFDKAVTYKQENDLTI